MNNWNIDKLTAIASMFDSDAWRRVSAEASASNELFTPANIDYATQSIKEKMLEQNKLQIWLSRYTRPNKPSKRVGIIMAGNIPMVGFFDLLAVVASGHSASIKTSSKDQILMGYIVEYLANMGFDVELTTRIDRYDIDALIATGSDTSINSIAQDFRGIPSIFRGSRRSIAIISDISQINTELINEITRYWGLGCRSVSHLFLKQPAINAHDVAITIQKQLLNYDLASCRTFDDSYRYSKALNTMLGNGCDCSRFMLIPSTIEHMVGIAEVGYSYFDSQEELENEINSHKDKIQYISLPPYGQSQKPELWDYADGIDLMDFLIKLY